MSQPGTMGTMAAEIIACPPELPLRLTDRCDRCGAAAYVRVTLPSGMDLLFCGHDFATHEVDLVATGGVVRDERHRLLPQPVEP